MKTTLDTKDEDGDEDRNSWWPKIDIWFVTVALVAMAIFVLLTFELWVSH